MTLLVVLTGHAGPFGGWGGWDARWYIGIADHGYGWSLDGKPALAFFPLLPLLLRLGMIVGLPPVVTGMAVSNLAFLGALFYLHRLALPYGDIVATRSVWLLALLPTALFTAAPYTESLFLLSAAATLFYCTRSRPAQAPVSFPSVAAPSVAPHSVAPHSVAPHSVAPHSVTTPPASVPSVTLPSISLPSVSPPSVSPPSVGEGFSPLSPFQLALAFCRALVGANPRTGQGPGAPDITEAGKRAEALAYGTSSYRDSRRHRWDPLFIGIALAAAVMTRSTGLILIPLALLAMPSYRTRLTALLPAGVAGAVYVLYLRAQHLSPLGILSAQAAWHRSLTPPWTGFTASFHWLLHHAPDHPAWAVENALSLTVVVGCLALTAALWTRLPLLTRVYCVAFWVLFLCTPEWRDAYYAPFSSADRLVLALFPLVPGAVTRISRFRAVAGASAALLSGAAAVHLLGGWVG